MNNRELARSIKKSISLLLLCTTLCMAALAGLAVYTLRTIAHGQKAHAETFVPAKRLTAGFEREVLNARIFFIYYVTIQKPGSLASGWERFHNAEASLRQMGVMVNQRPELANLRGPVAQLQKDLANYNLALSDTLNMVSSGERSGPHYDAQVKEWAARGATMVKDAATVETLTFKTGEANTIEILNGLRDGEDHTLFVLLGSFGLSLLVSVVLSAWLKTVVDPRSTTTRASASPLLTTEAFGGAL